MYRAWTTLFPQRLPLRHHANLYAQLARLLHAGVPLHEGLRNIAESRANRRLSEVCEALAASVGAGGSLAAAVRLRPEIPEVDAALIEAGEMIGALPSTFSALADRLERKISIRGRILSALAYPLLLAALSVVLLAIPTYVLSGQAAFGREVAGGLATIGLMLVLALWVAPRILAIPAVSDLLRRVLRRTPGLGRLYVTSVRTVWTEQLRAALEAGVLLSVAVRQAGLVTGDRAARGAMERVARRVEAGDRFVDALREQGFLPASDLVLLAGGEHSGTLPASLAALCTAYGQALRRGLTVATRVGSALAATLILTFVAGRIIDNFARVLGGGMSEAMQQIQKEVGPGGPSGIDGFRKMVDELSQPLESEFPYDRPP